MRWTTEAAVRLTRRIRQPSSFFTTTQRATICNTGKPMTTPSASTAGPIQQAIEHKIAESLRPTAFKIANDSQKHAGHAGNPSGAPDAETHFTCTIESSAFEGKSRVQQHRMVYALLGDEFAQGLHALALKTSAPQNRETT